MSGICLTIDKNRQLVLNELINVHLQNEEQLDLLNESVSELGLITTTSYDILKKSITDKDKHSLLSMLSNDNQSKLYELALIKSSMWNDRKELKIYIYEHTFNPEINKKIEFYSKEWEEWTGIKFNFTNDPSSEIRIRINALSVHESYIGKDALKIGNLLTETMKLGIGIETNENSIKRTILHEFGHALGCIHEHQSPSSSIKWDEPAVIRCCALGGWDEAKVRHNIFGRYTSSEITNSKFDKKSIMIYPIPADWTIDGYSVGWNNRLSDFDKKFIKIAYSMK